MRRTPAHVTLHALFFCSGASGLIYEVVWVREFGNIFGNTVYSASLVVAVFMLGLVPGGFAVGRWADRRRAARGPSLVKTYGWFELGIGLWGLLISLLLPHLGEFSALISSYVREPGGWYAMSAMSVPVALSRSRAAGRARHLLHGRHTDPADPRGRLGPPLHGGLAGRHTLRRQHGGRGARLLSHRRGPRAGWRSQDRPDGRRAAQRARRGRRFSARRADGRRAARPAGCRAGGGPPGG